MNASFSLFHTLLRKAVLPATIVLIAAYGTMAQRTKPVAKGEWGGTGIAVSVTDGGATIQFDCASGTLVKQLRMKSDGSFSAEGTLMRNGPGPIHVDDQATPVRFNGKVVGKRMTIHVADAKTGASIGDHVLTKGAAASLHRCY